MSYSTFLNGRDPSQLRGLQWLSLSEAGIILTRSFVSDGGGGGTSSWTAAGTVPCRIDPITNNTGDSRVTGGRIDERSTHLVTVPSGSSVSASGRFAISGRGTFEITATHQQTAEWSRVFEVIEAS